MDQADHQEIQDQLNFHAVFARQFVRNYPLLKRTLKFLLSFSLFSLVFWLCSGSFFFFNNFHFYFNSCLLSLLSHSLERKYVFLVCNGILAFLAKRSVSYTSSYPFGSEVDDDQFSFSGTSDDISVAEAAESSLVDGDEVLPVASMVSHEEDEKEHNEAAAATAAEEGEGDKLPQEEKKETSYVDESEVKEEEEGRGFMMQEEEDEEGGGAAAETNEELASTEELNRRFEEFIIKMKEEIRIEAQRQLIAV